jgi:hypothetical protein
MKRIPFTENLKEQLQKIKAYHRSKATGETYEEALAAVQAEQNKN